MKVVFLGVGEACDELQPNNSHLVVSRTKLLLDCGYSAARQLWKYNPDSSFIDGIFVSHIHADHSFGIPGLVVRMWEERRTKPLSIICQEGTKRVIEDLIDCGYPSLRAKLGFEINFIAADAKRKVTFNELELRFAPTIHSISNLAVRVSDGNNVVCYSGDGMFSNETERLYTGCDLLIHESYSLTENIKGHANAKALIDLVKRSGIKCLALTHIQRELRRNKPKMSWIKEEAAKRSVKLIIPEPLEKYQFK